MTLEPLLWLHCSVSGRYILEYIIGTQSFHGNDRTGELNSPHRCRAKGEQLRGFKLLYLKGGGRLALTSSMLALTAPPPDQAQLHPPQQCSRQAPRTRPPCGAPPPPPPARHRNRPNPNPQTLDPKP